MSDAAVTHPDWQDLLDTYNPITQLWDAAIERWDVTGGFKDPSDQPPLIDTMPVTLGEVDIVTNWLSVGPVWTNTFTFTNTYVVTSNITRVVDIRYPNTRGIGPVLYPLIAGGTGTAYPWEGGIVNYITEAFWYHYEFENGPPQLPVDYYVDSTAAILGSYDAWFSKTNDAGAYPQTPPMETLGAIFRRKNIGFCPVVSVDSWGHTNQSHTGDFAPRFSTWASNRNERTMLSSLQWAPAIVASNMPLSANGTYYLNTAAAGIRYTNDLNSARSMRADTNFAAVIVDGSDTPLLAAPDFESTVWLDLDLLPVLGAGTAMRPGVGAWFSKLVGTAAAQLFTDSALWGPVGEVVELTGPVMIYDAQPRIFNAGATTGETHNVTLRGWAFLPVLTNDPAFPFRQSNATETITVGDNTNGYACTLKWLQIDHMTIDAPGQTGASYYVSYDGPFSRFDPGGAGGVSELVTTMDEQKSVLEELKWTTQPMGLTNLPGSAQGWYEWSGWGRADAATHLTVNSTAPQWPSARVDSSPNPSISPDYADQFFSGINAGDVDVPVDFSGSYRKDWQFQVTYGISGYIELDSFTSDSFEVDSGGQVFIGSTTGGAGCEHLSWSLSGCKQVVFTTVCDGQGVIHSQWDRNGDNTICGDGIVVESISITDIQPLYIAERKNGAIDIRFGQYQTNAFLTFNDKDSTFDIYLKAEKLVPEWQIYDCGSGLESNEIPLTVTAPTDWGMSDPGNGYFIRVDTRTGPGSALIDDGLGAIEIPYSGQSYYTKAWNVTDGLVILKWDADSGGFFLY